MSDTVIPLNEAALLVNGLTLGAILFGVGLIGFLVRRNMIVMFLCVEMMLQGVSVSFVAWGRYHDNFDGQMMVLFVIAVAACEAAIALALIINLFQRGKTLDMVFWQDLREEGLPPYLDYAVPEESAAEQLWPALPAAGIEPLPNREEELHRSRI